MGTMAMPMPHGILCQANRCSLSRNCVANDLGVEALLRKLRRRALVHANGLGMGLRS